MTSSGVLRWCVLRVIVAHIKTYVNNKSASGDALTLFFHGLLVV